MEIVESTLDSTKGEREGERAPCTHPEEYISIRITQPVHDWSRLSEDCEGKPSLIKGCAWYISFPHFGKSGNNPHYHVLIPGKQGDCGRYRKRAQSLGYTGNKQLSVKYFQNGILSGIQYASREKTQPITWGTGVDQWLSDAPEWLDAKLRSNLNPLRSGKEDPEGIRVTQKNFLRLAWSYRKENNLHSTDVADIFMHMFSNGHYLCPTFARQGMPTFYLDIFKDSCEKGRLQWYGSKSSWKHVVFRDSRF